MMNNRTLIQFIIIFCSLILGMVLYPIILRKWRNFVDWLYRATYGEGKTELPTKQEELVEKKESNPSIIGKSKTVLGQSRTKATTSSENDGVVEKEDIFVPESDEDAEPMDEIHVPLEKEENLAEEDAEATEEELAVKLETGAILASGTSYDELMNTNETIRKDAPTADEKDEAGRILLENQNTQLFENVMTGNEKLSQSIASIIDFHVAKRNKEVNPNEQTDLPAEVKDFDANSIF